MFAADDEDGDFMSPTGGAKLASLFSLDQTGSQTNESFQYTAPKQPRKSSGPPVQKAAPPPGSPAVLSATAVQAYRYVNGQYMKQGKLGAAVLGNHADKEYKLLLYVSQQKPVTAARIHSGFSFTVQPSNYCTFYDDQRQNWSLMFESEKAATDFCKEVCLAKANCASPLEVLVTQELVPGEGQGVENGDSLEVAYTGWLLQNHTIGQMFDSNLNKDKLLRMKLGSGKVIKGWEEGMLNMRKGGRRLLVVPPALAYGSQGVPGRIPPDSTLVFEAEIRRVKFAKDAGSSMSSRDTAVPSPAPSVESLGPDLTSAASRAGEPPLRAKSNSLSEQLANPDATKAKLISRMAKMGQPMLPFLAGPASSPSQAESSDSELEDPSASRLKERPPVPSPQPVNLTSGPSASLQATALMPVSMATPNPQPVMPVAGHGFQPYSYTQSTTASSHLQPVGQIYPSQTVPYQGSGDVTSFLMTEARQHNTEIRLAVSKVGDKVDQLAAKVEELHRQGGLPLGLSNVSMDTTMIMNTIQRIIQENECLKKEVFEKSSRIEEQNRKIGELINQNQRCMEQSNMLMEQRNDSLKNSSEQNQARILLAEQEKHALQQDVCRNQARLTDELASSTARVSELQLELTAQRQKAAALQSSLSAALQDGQQHNAQLTATETQLQEMKELAERAQAQYRAEKQKRKELELKLSNLDEELQDMKSEKESLERTLSDRKRKWQAERQRCDEELEEVRKASQVEMDQLRSQLRKARTNTDQAAAEQLAQLQADVEREWQAKCERALASAREQQHRDVTELTEQRDTLQLKLAQLQDKFSVMKQSREEEEQRLLREQDQGEELQALRDKCCELERRAESLRQQGEERVSELERRLAEQKGEIDTTGEVKRVMNGVFQSLRGEFELQETYTGSVVLGILVNTIKNVTLQLLSKSQPSSSENKKEEEEEEGEDEEEEDRRSEAQSEEQEKHARELHLNGKKEDVEDEMEEVREEKMNESETVEEDKEEEEGGQEVVRGKEEEEGGQEVFKSKKEEEGRQEVVKTEEGEVGGQEVVRGKEEEEGGQEVGNSKEEKEGGQEVIRGKVEVKGGQEVEGAKEEVKEAEREPDRLKAGQLVQQSDITPHMQAQNDVIPKQEVITGPLGDITPEEEDEEEVVAKTESTLRLVDESEADETIKTGPPKNPPPPPTPAEKDGAETAAQPGSPSERIEEVNSEQPFFQSPALTKPPPLPTSEEEEEEEEEVSLKGRPPPTPLFGDDSDDDDLDWMS